ncbi:MAG: mobile mystery protein A [Gemmatimonadaceae bacterium]|nr:mobile mystery protein A [Gemmatimonadaceae bacterium]
MPRRLGTIQQRHVEAQLKALGSGKQLQPPASGWVRTIRRALGMTTAELARRLGVSRQAVTQLEIAEQRGTASWTSLRKAANAMDCDLAYAILPRGSLTDVLMRQAREQARRHVERSAHSMELGSHPVDAVDVELQVEEVARHLAAERSSALWTPEPGDASARPARRPRHQPRTGG